MSIDEVREAYSGRASEYVEVVGRIEHAAEADREAILAWARSVDGPILDVGCGPGQWTSFLHEAGLDVEGVDPVAAFMDDARARYPSARFRGGRAEASPEAQRELAAGAISGDLCGRSGRVGRVCHLLGGVRG